MVRESAEVIRNFVTYYRDLGADEVLLYHDGPSGHLAGLAEPGLALTTCDQAFWRARGRPRPHALEAQLSVVYRLGLDRCRSDWLLAVDADEFVFGDRPVREFLGAIPSGFDAVSLPTAEAVWGPGDDIHTPFGSSYFRLAWDDERLWHRLGGLLYGKAAPLLNRGLAGHCKGKQFLRAGRRYSQIGGHVTRRDGAIITWPAPLISEGFSGMYLGHFDAIGPARWATKWRQRIEGETFVAGMRPSRLAQMQATAAALGQGEAEAAALFGRLYRLSLPQYAAMAALGYAFRRPGIARAPAAPFAAAAAPA
ncbi:MAG TPA: glycosyltransferase family 2 protein [Paracoccaceae bacterium]|nr:glycosyltransferase family 2 protein [Paracoccaceae bacterium]